MPAVFDTLKERGVVVDKLRDVFRAPKEDVDPAWDHGGAVDRELWSVLVRCGKDGIPEGLMLSFPASVREGEQGLRAWQHLFRRVLLVSDQSIAALQAAFVAPQVVRRKGELLGALVEWENLVEELGAAGNKPWDPAVRMSLTQLCSGVEEAKRSAEALAAVHDPVPVDLLLARMKAVAIQFAAVEQQQMGFVALPAPTPSGGRQGQGTRTGRCKFWDQGRCHRGNNCSFHHVGEAGNGFQGPWGPTRAPKAQSQVAQLTAAVTALVARLESPTADKPKWCVDRSLPNALSGYRAHNCNNNTDNDKSVKPGRPDPPPQVSNRQVKPSAKSTSVGVMTPLTPSVLVDQREGEVSDKPEKPAAHSAPGGHTAVAAPGVNWDLKPQWDSTPPGAPQREGEVCNNDNSIQVCEYLCGVPTECDMGVGLLGGLNSAAYTAVPTSLVDSGASTHMTGADNMHLAENVKPSVTPTPVRTVNGTVYSTCTADIPSAIIPIKNARVLEECPVTLISPVQICRESSLGFEIDKGGTGARFHDGDRTVQELTVNENNLIEMPLIVPGLGDKAALVCDTECTPESSVFVGYTYIPSSEMYILDEHVHLHDRVMAGGNVLDAKLDCMGGVCTCMLSESALAKHYIDGHRPTMPDCPWCTQAGMRHRKANRVAHSDRLGKLGFSISVDFTGPFEPDVDGHKFALVGVEIASSLGFVALHTDRTAK